MRLTAADDTPNAEKCGDKSSEAVHDRGFFSFFNRENKLKKTKIAEKKFKKIKTAKK